MERKAARVLSSEQGRDLDLVSPQVWNSQHRERREATWSELREGQSRAQMERH